jgi:ribosome-binding factor A
MSLRTDRVSSVIKEEIGALFTREFRDRSFGLITVTDVQMTPDLRIAKVYVSIFGDDGVKGRTMEMLENEKPRIRAMIGSSIRLKFTPTLQFYLDDTLDRVETINRLIKQIHKEDPPGENR